MSLAKTEVLFQQRHNSAPLALVNYVPDWDTLLTGHCPSAGRQCGVRWIQVALSKSVAGIELQPASFQLKRLDQ
ncbi:hypothetical protein ANANG_G00007280 [Anguilla anguilla]|uniref:Uncharacterized protein n=1 Tax=Anguilla anguilla TaxID=7936 RepID=A0A9D3MZ01_ANGAN|nr:hypothetical protein ANANG_G00007280 [Anguilla anguilla]